MASIPLQRVLYVEDDLVLQMLVARTLQKVSGIKVDICADGRSVAAKARECLPQLILLDVMMPDIDGPSVLALLRAEPDLATIPVAFITGKTRHDEVERLHALGAIGVIAKPFNPQTLASTVGRLWADAG